jgi:hypothetical protein
MEKLEYVFNRQVIAASLYDALELALGECYARHLVPDEWENLFASQVYPGHEQVLRNRATKVGFRVSKANCSILQVKSGSIRRIKQGKVDLTAFLAMLIVGASIAGASKDNSHPFQALAAGEPDFLDFVLELKRLRKPIKHGDITDFKMDEAQLDVNISKVQKILRTLLPPIAADLELEDKSAYSPKEDVNQERLKAELALDRALGLAFVRNLPPAVKEQLIRCERLSSRHEKYNDAPLATALTSALEQALFDVIQERKSGGRAEGARKEAAMGKIVVAGFYQSVSDIPEEITTVNAEYVRHAAHGGNSTLGGQTLALFLVCLKDELDRLKKSHPLFLESIAGLIRLRGGGNKIVHPMSEEDWKGKKNEVFKLLKTLAEVF